MKHPLSPDTRTRITGIYEEDTQPNAVDLKVEKIFIPGQDTFILSEDVKTHRTSKELPTREFRGETGWWCLQPGYYEVVFANKIGVGNREAGFVISRSTLIRNGVYLLSGLYDSGYEGGMVSGLHVTTGPFYVRYGTRLGQFLLFDAGMIREYDGSYGSKKKHDNEKYEKKVKGIEEGTWVDKRFKNRPPESGQIKKKEYYEALKQQQQTAIERSTVEEQDDDVVENDQPTNLEDAMKEVKELL